MASIAGMNVMGGLGAGILQGLETSRRWKREDSEEERRARMDAQALADRADEKAFRSRQEQRLGRLDDEAKEERKQSRTRQERLDDEAKEERGYRLGQMAMDKTNREAARDYASIFSSPDYKTDEDRLKAYDERAKKDNSYQVGEAFKTKWVGESVADSMGAGDYRGALEFAKKHGMASQMPKIRAEAEELQKKGLIDGVSEALVGNVAKLDEAMAKGVAGYKPGSVKMNPNSREGFLTFEMQDGKQAAYPYTAIQLLFGSLGKRIPAWAELTGEMKPGDRTDLSKELGYALGDLGEEEAALKAELSGEDEWFAWFDKPASGNRKTEIETRLSEIREERKAMRQKQQETLGLRGGKAEPQPLPTSLGSLGDAAMSGDERGPAASEKAPAAPGRLGASLPVEYLQEAGGEDNRSMVEKYKEVADYQNAGKSPARRQDFTPIVSRIRTSRAIQKQDAEDLKVINQVLRDKNSSDDEFAAAREALKSLQSKYGVY